MSLAPVDVLEEDAADLQFPKDDEIISINAGASTEHRVQHYRPTKPAVRNVMSIAPCNCCQTELQEPYIKCAECFQLICLKCFSNGAETLVHRNTHSYIIRHDNVRVFPSTNWLAKEEKLLLELLITHGYGNWTEIAKSLKTKTANECRTHYFKHYFNGIFTKVLGLESEPYFPETIPYLYKMNSIEPPRQDLDSIHYKTMAGYRAARGDFDVPFDNSAETIISHLQWLPTDYRNRNDASQDIYNELNCAVFRAYNHRLRERKRRYKIMRKHGLLVASRTLSWLSKHADALGCSQGQSFKLGNIGRFISFMQLTDGIAFDMLVESMQYAHDLRKYILRLYDLRRNGIRSFNGAKIFYKLHAQRTSKVRDKRSEQFETKWEWKQLVSNNAVIGTNIPLYLTNPGVKRKSTPLEVLGLPGYNKLTDEEKELCSTVRLVPLAYMDYKNILVTENAKIGYLRLADARRLIKIDVNKTRQLYDFLLKSGFISKPFS